MSKATLSIPQYQGTVRVSRSIEPAAGNVLGFDSNKKLVAVDPSTLAETSPTITTPVIAGGLTASGSGANDFSASTGTFKTSTGTNTIGGATNSAFDLTFTSASKGTIFKQGSNGRVGTFTLNGATPVSVSNTSVAITDAIVISLNTVGGTVGVQPHVVTITGASGFTVVGTASDTSVYNYALIKNAA